MGKKLIAVVLVAAAVAIAYFAFGKDFFGASFEQGFAQIGEIDSKYGIGETALIPANADETKNYIYELNALKTKFESGAASREKSALALLVESKINAADAQKSMIEGAEAYRRISKVEYECGEGETAVVAGINFKKAVENAERALSLRGTFLENYPDFSKISGISETDTGALALKALSESAGELVKNIEAYCNIQNA